MMIALPLSECFYFFSHTGARLNSNQCFLVDPLPQKPLHPTAITTKHPVSALRNIKIHTMPPTIHRVNGEAIFSSAKVNVAENL